MSQFDSYTYSTQVFWSLLSFTFFYFFILNFYIIPFSSSLKMRKKLVLLIDLKKKKKSPLNISNSIYFLIFYKI